MILCPQLAAISNALFACSCPSTYLKSYLFSHSILLSFHIFLKSKTSATGSSFHPFNICMTSSRLSTGITSIHGTIEASGTFCFGRNILLNHFSFAPIVAGSTLETFLSFPSSESSHKNIESFVSFSSMCHPLSKIHIAIGKSNAGPDFLIFAGARLTVILVIGSLFPADFIADLSLSLLSCTHWSGSHTITKLGKPLFISTSISTK
jgi:hypothetical protein